VSSLTPRHERVPAFPAGLDQTSVRPAQLRILGAREQLCRRGRVAAQLRDARQVAPGPCGQLAIAELLCDADRASKVLLRFIEPAEISLRDAARGPGVRHLPPGAELVEDGDAAVEVRQRLLRAIEVVEDPTGLNGCVGSGELVARLLSQRARVLYEMQCAVEVA